MELQNLWQQTAFALLGGTATEILHWYSLTRRAEGASQYTTSPVYWISTVAMIALGGFMPFLYINGPTSSLLCFHLGAATPLMLQKLIMVAPEVAVPQGNNRLKRSIKDFCSW